MGKPDGSGREDDEKTLRKESEPRPLSSSDWDSELLTSGQYSFARPRSLLSVPVSPGCHRAYRLALSGVQTLDRCRNGLRSPSAYARCCRER